MPLDHAALLDGIRTETEKLARIVEEGDPSGEMSACPGWRLNDVAVHIGEVQRSWAWRVSRDAIDQPLGRPPIEPPGSDLAEYVRNGGQALVSALDRAGPAGPCWTWWGEPATTSAVARHQLHEVALHRWDAEESSSDEPEQWSPEQAADGIDELLFVTHSVEIAPWVGPKGVLVIDPEDVDELWTVDRTGGHTPLMSRGGAGTYDMRLLGTAADLQLLLWNRPRSFRYRGEPQMLNAFLAWPDLS